MQRPTACSCPGASTGMEVTLPKKSLNGMVKVWDGVKKGFSRAFSVNAAYEKCGAGFRGNAGSDDFFSVCNYVC